MRRLLPAIAVAAFSIPGTVAAEWYWIRGSGKPDKTFLVAADGKTHQLPLYKFNLQVTKLVLRRDSDRADYYWLEATLTEWRDSGGGYLLIFDDVTLGEIYTRGDKWAIGFESLELGRRCLEHLRKLHNLKPEPRLGREQLGQSSEQRRGAPADVCRDGQDEASDECSWKPGRGAASVSRFPRDRPAPARAQS